MEQCVFCKIVVGEMPANQKEHEDENCFVIHDIHPSAPVHLLVVAKRHGIEFASSEADYLQPLLKVVREMIVLKGIERNYRIAINGGSATMVHDHLHIHVLGNIDKHKNI